MTIQRNNAPWRPLRPAAPVWDGSALRSSDYGDIYFSVQDGPAESRYVFIDGNRLVERFSALAPGETLTIAELGFGTGLNCLLTLEQWRQHAPRGARLHYIGIDAQPLTAVRFTDISGAWPDLAFAAELLGEQWPHPVAGCHRRQLPEIGVRLDLWWEPADAALADLASHGQRWVDAWYLDGFAPAQNPDMWGSQLWPLLAQLSRPGATVATFTAAGSVRRGLSDVGFEMHKRPGFGRKRESLLGEFTGAEPSIPSLTPWDLALPGGREQALVVGAGLAGAHVARAIAERGTPVTVLEAGRTASGGSVNRQGITYTRLSRRFGTLSDFALASYQYAIPHYRRLFRDANLTTGEDGSFCGYLQLSDDQDTLDHLGAVLDGDCPLARIVAPGETEALTGLALDSAGIWYPEAAWLYPTAICRALLGHPLITLVEQTGPVQLRREGHWQAYDPEDRLLASADIAVIAAAHHSLQFPEMDWLPLQVIRGQTTQIANTGGLEALRSVVCHTGYLPPAVAGEHCIGASFGPNDDALDERAADHQHNLEQLSRALPGLQPLPEPRGGRVALRCNSSDYLPVVGPVVDAGRFAEVYAPLRNRSKAVSRELPPVHEGLWVLAGLGSRGLTAAPLAAESIAAQIFAEPAPLPRYLQRAISPTRFLERRLKRGEL